MKCFDQPLFQAAGFRSAVEALNGRKGPVRLIGSVDSEKVHMMMRAGDFKTRLIVTYDEQDAVSLAEDARFFSEDVCYFPAKDLLFYQADAKSGALMAERLKAIKKLLSGEPVTIVATVQAMMNALPPKEAFLSRMLTLSEGDTLEIRALTEKLLELGYERTAAVEEPGSFAVHGGIVDVFDLTEANPIRIEFFDDEIDTIRVFHPVSQVSVKRLKTVSVFPSTEFLMSRERLIRGRQSVDLEYEKVQKTLKNRKDLDAAASLQAFYREVSDGFDRMDFRGIIEQFLPFFYEEVFFPESYLPDDSLIVVNEPIRTEDFAKLYEQEFLESFKLRLEKGMTFPTLGLVMRTVAPLKSALTTPRTLFLTALDQKLSSIRADQSFSIDCQRIVPYESNIDRMTEDLNRFQKLGFTVLMLIGSRLRASRIAEDLRERNVKAFFEEKEKDPDVKPGQVLVTNGTLSGGFVYPMQRFAVLTESDMFGHTERKKRKKRFADSGERIRSFQDISVGDYVVHENYGIGIYKGVVTLTTDQVARDYMEISYADSGTLYVPVTNLDVVQKYASADAKPPKINRLDSPEWKRTRSRVRTAVEEIADNLVKLYSERQFSEGYEFGPDTVWQREFEEMFPYEETEDQLQAIRDVKQDMESNKIMDRLILGDVGFGKTEVAIRAAFKAVQEGKQVAFLVPTTILAEQHYHTFTDRMHDYPVTVELLSRFRTEKEQNETIRNLKRGVTDIVIGTHKLLNNKVEFKDLGLLIIDEEQRFGVMHKEKIKELKTNVDVLTLSATPIPRTLHMSMIGVRDMSVLTEPPEDRRAIQTYVMEYSEELVREAIQREIARNGQVYYVYNRANDIADVAAGLEELLPEAAVTYIHGRMNEREIENRMLSFIEGRIDVLVSTTIIESGLDIPNVNTIIIHDAERYGLAQLYQLRGRVGRSSRQSYAFIMYRKNRVLSEVAEKRLSAIRQFTELGSGMKIALEDLEIRGAGTLLGNAQSGHMALVGYDLYCKMLSDAVREAKGEKKRVDAFDTVLDIPVDAYVPESYVEDESLKMEVYKRISLIRNDEDRSKLEDELVDRYGDIPKPVENLIRVALLRAYAHDLYLTEVKGNARELRFRFTVDAEIRAENLPALINRLGGKMRFLNGETPMLLYRDLMDTGVKKEPLAVVSGLIGEMREFLLQPERGKKDHET